MGGLIRGRYEPLEVVARGGQGELIRALDRQHGRQVALKVRRVRSEDEREAILAEARVLLNVKPHRGIPLLREDFFEDEAFHLVMDWVEGESLQRALDDRGDPGLPFDSVCAYLSEVAEALDHLHASDPPIVHGDVKPANIILIPDGRAVLVDFGISQPQGEAIGRTWGTPGFVAPELASGDHRTPASDIYGLAATAVALLTGSPPGLGARPNWGAFPKEEARRLDLAMRRGLALDPSRRPESASELIRAMRSEPRIPNNLPVQLTSFIGREPEVAEVEKLLDGARLLTLTGAGGVGKTRLSIQVAAEVVEQFPDGAWVVELAALSDPGLVPQTVASALGLREQPGRSLTQTVTDHLLTRHLLLVLDNCEHLIGACAELAEGLLRACPHLKILATSRERLGVAGEVTWRVPSLRAPTPDQIGGTEDLIEYEAARLFMDRAALARPDFALSKQRGRAVALICLRLDGIPLAIELAAARVGSLPLEQIADRLDDRFRLLAGGARTALPRQQTLRATIDWSNELLAEAERALFRRVSVFAGGFTPEAAEAVCSADLIAPSEVLDLLGRLLDKSLALLDEGAGRPRYFMLETVRQYAREKLVEAGEEDLLRRRQLDWFVQLARRAEPELRGPDQAEWLQHLDDEHDNLRAALAWAGTESQDPDAAVRLTADLRQFWHVRGFFGEGREWFRVVLSWSAVPPANAARPSSARAGSLRFRTTTRRHVRSWRRVLRSIASLATLSRSRVRSPNWVLWPGPRATTRRHKPS